MVKFFLNIVLFIGVLVVGYSLLLFLWGTQLPKEYHQNLIYDRGGYGHTLSRMEDAKVAKNTQVLILGSSHAYRGFDVQYMLEKKIRAFNLGSSAQSQEQTEMLVERYLDKLDPELVLIEVAPGVLALDGVESTLVLFANDFIDHNSLKLALKVNHLRVYNTLLYAYTRDLFGENDGIIEKKIKGSQKYRTNGYVESGLNFFKKQEHPPRYLKLRKEQLSALKRIIEELKERELPYYLIQAPITQGVYKSYTNLDEYKAIMHELGPFYDFNKILQLDDSLHFYDAYHMNQNGVEIFNQKLIDTLELDTRWE